MNPQLWLYVAAIPFAVLLHEYLRLDLKRAVFRRMFAEAIKRMGDQIMLLQRALASIGISAEEAAKSMKKLSNVMKEAP